MIHIDVDCSFESQ